MSSACSQKDTFGKITAKWIWDSSIFSSIKAKTWQAIVCLIMCFSPNLPVLRQKLFWTSKQNNFWPKTGKFGENPKVNKQSLVMFWLDWKKYGSVSYSLICTYLYVLNFFLFVFTTIWNWKWKMGLWNFHGSSLGSLTTTWTEIYHFYKHKLLQIHIFCAF